jgi:hypothetical protein
LCFAADDPPAFDIKLERLLTNCDVENVRFQPKKCFIGCSGIRYLAWRVCADGKKIPPERLERARSWPIPLSKNDADVFKGYINYYRSAIPKLSHHLSALQSLMSGPSWESSPALVAAWNTLLQCVADAIQVATPHPGAPTSLEVDASDGAVGWLAMQEGVVVGVGGRALTKCEKRWPIRCKEMWAAIYGLRKVSAWLGHAPITVLTDHLSNVGDSCVEMDAARRWARWSAELQCYNVSFSYVPGSCNGGADYLSRNVDWGGCGCLCCEDHDNVR